MGYVGFVRRSFYSCVACGFPASLILFLRGTQIPCVAHFFPAWHPHSLCRPKNPCVTHLTPRHTKKQHAPLLWYHATFSFILHLQSLDLHMSYNTLHAFLLTPFFKKVFAYNPTISVACNGNFAKKWSPLCSINPSNE